MIWPGDPGWPEREVPETLPREVPNGDRPNSYYSATSPLYTPAFSGVLNPLNSAPSYFVGFCCGGKKRFMRGRSWNMPDIAELVKDERDGCEVVYFEVSAHCGGNTISGLQNLKRRLEFGGPGNPSPDAISVAEFVQAFNPDVFHEQAVINLEMCYSRELEPKLFQRLGSGVEIHTTIETNHDLPGTPEMWRFYQFKCDECPSK